MFTTIKDFVDQFTTERANTLKIFGALADESLGQNVAHDHRTLGRLAWHITLMYVEGAMTRPAGLNITGAKEDSTPPKTAAEIREVYDNVSRQFLDQIKENWTDASLQEERDFFGTRWRMGFMLEVILRHEIHHRGQMTVLMRQAGLKVPGVYGPAYEEWKNFGAEPPKV